MGSAANGTAAVPHGRQRRRLLLLALAAAALMLVQSGAGATGPGTLVVTVAGLPSGVTGAVVVRGPGGYRHAVGSTTTLRHLRLGRYGIAASSVTSGGSPYNATVSRPDALLTVTKARRRVSVTYVKNGLVVATARLPDATAGAAYTATLQAKGGRPPYRWALPWSPRFFVNLGDPDSLLTPGGFIHATATTAGETNIEVTVTDAAGTKAFAAVPVNVAEGQPGTLNLSFPGLPQSRSEPTVRLRRFASHTTYAAPFSAGQSTFGDFKPGVFYLDLLPEYCTFVQGAAPAADACWLPAGEYWPSRRPLVTLAPGQALTVTIPYVRTPAGTLVIHTSGVPSGATVGFAMAGLINVPPWAIVPAVADYQLLLAAGTYTIGEYHCPSGGCIGQEPPRANPPPAQQLHVTVVPGQITQLNVDY